jgi:Mg-chelatase subunit ChlD
MTLPFELGVVRAAWPAFLLPLLLLPLLLIFPGRSRLAATARALAAAALLAVLAGLYVEQARPSGGACVVAAIDVSASVQQAGANAARAFLTRLLPALGPDDLVGALAFAAVPRLLARPVADPSLESLLPAPAGDPGIDTGDTDLGATVAAAASLCPEGKQAALLLFTDGNETEGSLAAETAVTEPVIPIYPIVPATAALPPVAVRRVIVPPLTPERTIVPLEVVVEQRGGAPVSGLLRLTANGEELALAALEAQPTLGVTALPHRWEGPGHFRIEAEAILPPGTPPAAGRASAAMTITRGLHVLVVSEHAAPVVAAALRRRDMDVDVVGPGGLARELGEYHLVVLDNVARAGLAADALERLAEWVDAGGALVATGGAHLFGDPGFVGSPLERVLPVTLQSQAPEPKEREPIALYLLIDRSNSMGYATSQPALAYGEKMEYAKRAALAVLEQLSPSDLVGAVAFDAQPYELGPLRSVADGRAALAARIAALKYGGGTDFKDAVDIALQSLLQLDRRVRHIILLTDGDTNRRAADHDPLIAALARAEITVTAIRIGSDAVNLELLERIASATGGEFHHVEDVQSLPQLMVHDAQQLIDMAANRQEARVYVGDGDPLLAGIAEDELPPVTAWAITRPKAGAELRLYVESGERQDPVLATWQYRLGRVAVVPIDFQAGGARWPVWSGFTQLWSQLALWAAPHALPGEWHLDARRVRGGAVVSLQAVADGDEPFRLRVPGHGEVWLHPTGRRRFSAFVRDLDAGLHAGVLVAGGREQPVELWVPEAAASGRESRVREPNLKLLGAIAARTGGRVAPEPHTVLAARPGVLRRALPLESWLIPLALILVLADIAARRRVG